MNGRTAIVAILAILAVLVGAASAAELTGELGTGAGVSVVTVGPDNPTASGTLNALLNATMMNTNIKYPLFITARSVYNDGNGVLVRTGASWAKGSDGLPIDSQSEDVECYIGSTRIGSGLYYFNSYKYGSSTVVSLTFQPNLEDWDVSGFSGAQIVNFTSDDPNWHKYGLNNFTNGGNGIALAQGQSYILSTPHPGTFGGWYGSGQWLGLYAYAATSPPMMGYWQAYRYSFRNEYSFYYDKDHEIYSVTLRKTVDGIVYPSKGYVTNGSSWYKLWNESTVSGDDFTVDFFTLPLQLCVNDYTGNWFNTSVISADDFGYESATYMVTVQPDPAGVGQTLSVTASSSEGFGNVDAYSLTITDYGDPEVNGYDPIWIKKSNGHWYQFDGSAYSLDWGTSFPATVTITMDTPGTWQIEAVFWETVGGGGRAYDTFTVAGQGVIVPITFQTKDYQSGAIVAPSTIAIRSLGNTTWFNSTTATGKIEFQAIVGQYYQWQGSANGYDASALLSNKFTIERTVDIVLQKTITVPAGNNTCWVSVYDEDINPISGATVRLSDGQVKQTPSSGVVTFTVLEGGTYTITVSASGYVSQTRTVTVIATSNGFSFVLSPNYVTPTITPSGGVTVDDRTDEEKEDAMVGQVTDAGEGIVGLALLAVVLGLVKLFGK